MLRVPMGLSQGVSPGSTTITATLGSVSGSTTLTVTAATFVSIGVTPGEPEPRQRHPTAAHRNRHLYRPLDTEPHYLGERGVLPTQPSASVSNSAGSMGLVTAVSPGSTTITARPWGACRGRPHDGHRGDPRVDWRHSPESQRRHGLKPTSSRRWAPIPDNSTQNLTTQVVGVRPIRQSRPSAMPRVMTGLGTALNPGSTTINGNHRQRVRLDDPDRDAGNPRVDWRHTGEPEHRERDQPASSPQPASTPTTRPRT